MQYAWQEYRLDAVMRLAVVTVALQEGASEIIKRESLESHWLKMLCVLQKQKELRRKEGEFVYAKARLLHQHEQATGAWITFPGRQRGWQSSQRRLGRANT